MHKSVVFTVPCVILKGNHAAASKRYSPCAWNDRYLLLQQQAIMEQTEDSNTQLQTEVKDLKKQIQSFQSLSSKCKELEAENADLRQSVAESKEITSNFQNANALMIKEKQNLETCIEQLQSKLVSTQVHLEALQDERRALSESLAIQKQVNMRLEEIRNAKEDLVQESSSKTEYLSSVIHELSLANEDLKTEKNKLTEALSDLNGELSRLRKQNSPSHPSNSQKPSKTSTPSRKLFSLKQELEEQLVSDAKDLPSPLIGASFLNDSLNNSIASNQSTLDSILSCDSNNSSLESYSIIASQVANQFKDKKERALRQIEELDKLEKTPEIQQKQLQLKNQFDKDVEQFAEKVNILNLKKKNAEKRSAKLLVAMKKLKEESKQFQDERDKAFQKLGNLSLNTDQLDTRVSDLQNELANERMRSKDMEDKLKALEQQLIVVNGDLSRVRNDKDSIEESLNTHVSITF
ncbi:hypothetical protein AC249_AIPGENE22126 [Exaiptasia diaphana]|nr:hypothetical protein AC249_AIPGENE22126 [Exaiptasia diaphana]